MIVKQTNAYRDWLIKLSGEFNKLSERTRQIPPVTDPASYTMASALAKEWATLVRNMENERLPISKPFFDTHKKVISDEKTIVALIDKERSALVAGVAAYEFERDRAEREARQAVVTRINTRRNALTSLSDVYERAETFYLNATPLLTLWDIENLDDEGFAEEMTRVRKIHADYLTTLRDLKEAIRQKQQATQSATSAPEPTLTGTERAPYVVTSHGSGSNLIPQWHKDLDLGIMSLKAIREDIPKHLVERKGADADLEYFDMKLSSAIVKIQRAFNHLNGKEE